MKKATLEQGMKVQKMIVDKGTSDEHLQWMMELGALPDLLDANPEGFNREEFRKFLGLKPLNPPLLTMVGTVDVAATAVPFVARDRFVKNTAKNTPVKISYIWDNFIEWFLDKVEQPFGGSTLGCFFGSARGSSFCYTIYESSQTERLRLFCRAFGMSLCRNCAGYALRKRADRLPSKIARTGAWDWRALRPRIRFSPESNSKDGGADDPMHENGLCFVR